MLHLHHPARCLMLNLRHTVALSLLLAVVAFALPLLCRASLSWGLNHQPSTAQSSNPHTKVQSWPSSDTSSSITGTAAMSAVSSSSSVRRMAPLVIPAIGRHTATVIFVHGLGDTGHGWSDAVELWRKRPRLNEIKFILPHAPHIPITMNAGFHMPGWFDIVSQANHMVVGQLADKHKDRKSLQKGQEEDGPGVLQSREYFHGLIQQEVKDGIPAERIVLGGFSQGGAMSIFAGLTAPFKIGGIVGLSSWLLLNQTFREHIPEGNANRATPIFMGHGDRDPLVLYDLAKESEKALKAMGYDVTFKTYSGMQHSACLEELNDVEAFIGDKLPPKGDANKLPPKGDAN